MDAYPALFHLHAHVGRGRGDRRKQAEDAQAEAARMDPEQAARAAHHQLQPGLAVRESPWRAGGQLCSR